MIEPLTREAFRPFGDVISIESHAFRVINYGYADRFENMAKLDIADGGRPALSVFRARPVQFPFKISRLERHPSSSQAFLPRGNSRFLVVVAPPNDSPLRDQLRLFVTDGIQGINLHRNVWHHFLLTLDEEQLYFVLDRSHPDENTIEIDLASPFVIESAGAIPPVDTASK